MNGIGYMLAQAMNQPTLPTNTAWVRPMLVAIFVLFLAALIAGPIVIARSPREAVNRHTEEPGVREDTPHRS